MFASANLVARAPALAAIVAGACLVPATVAQATTFTVSGTLSGANPVSASATFSTSGSTLTLTLQNTSTAATSALAQVLTSFYFDLNQNGNNRPALTLVNGTGQVYQVIDGGGIAPSVYVPPATSGTAFTPGLGSSNLVASGTDYDTWNFRSGLNTSLPPNTYYGIGTVGNGTFGSPPGGTGFDGKLVNWADFGIFTGSMTNPSGGLAKPGKRPFDVPYLVKDTAVFTFSADRDLTNIVFTDPFMFGFGTGPDQRITIVPEPAALASLAGAAAVAGVVARRRRRTDRASKKRAAPGGAARFVCRPALGRSGLNHRLEVLEGPHAHLDARRLGGPILQFARERVLDTLLGGACRHLAPLDLHEPRDRKYADARALEGLVDLLREGLQDRHDVLLLEPRVLGDRPHDLRLRHGLVSRLLRHRQVLRKIVCGGTPTAPGSPAKLPKACVIRGSGNEIARRNPGFWPKKCGQGSGSGASRAAPSAPRGGHGPQLLATPDRP